MCVRKWLVIGSIVAVAVVANPRTASADWTLTPFVGWNFGGSADVSGVAAGASFSNKFEKKIDYGASLMASGARARSASKSTSAIRRTSSRTRRLDNRLRVHEQEQRHHVDRQCIVGAVGRHTRRVGASLRRGRRRADPHQRRTRRQRVRREHEERLRLRRRRRRDGLLLHRTSACAATSATSAAFRGSSDNVDRARLSDFRVLARLTRRVAEVLTTTPGLRGPAYIDVGRTSQVRLVNQSSVRQAPRRPPSGWSTAAFASSRSRPAA